MTKEAQETRIVTADQQQWLDWIVKIQSLAQAGLHYGHDRFDLERYAELRDIAAKMMAAQSDLPLAKVRQLFCNEEGYQTPKIDTRAAIFQDGKLLLVHESTGKWSLPGGWCDVDQSVASNTIKEAKEEAGLDVAVEPNIETTEARYFARHELPENIAEEKTSREQIDRCFAAAADPDWQTRID